MGIPKQQEAKVIYIKPKNFIIPSESEVAEYIAQKMNWPMIFSTYYGSKFWNFYQSKSWMVGRNPMKDWKACFNGQWQTIKDSKDEERLTSALRKQAKGMPINNLKTEDPNTLYLNDILSQYQRHPTWIDNSALIPIYDHLKAEKAIKLNSEQVGICKQMGPEKGKAQAVKFLFDKMIKQNLKF